MSKLFQLDAWIIARFESFSHWTQRTIGITSARWAQGFYLLGGFFTIWKAMNEGPIARIASGLILTGFIIRFVAQDRRSQQAGGETTANEAKITERFWRVMNISVIWLPLVTGVSFGWFEAGTLGLYFSACDDLPIAPSRLRQWIESLGTSQLQSEPEANQ